MARFSFTFSLVLIIIIHQVLHLGFLIKFLIDPLNRHFTKTTFADLQGLAEVLPESPGADFQLLGEVLPWGFVADLQQLTQVLPEVLAPI